MNNGWIDVKERAPQDGQDVNFVVESWNEAYNGRMLGGRYKYFEGLKDPHTFSTPGMTFGARFWQPMPSPPPQTEKQEQ